MDPLARSTRVLFAAALLATALALPLASAQVPPPTVAVSLAESSVTLGPSNSTTLTGTVSYDDTAPAVPGAGSTDATITLSAVAAAGWTIAIDPATPFTLAPGQSQDFTVTLTAPANADATTTVESGVTADAASAGGRSATASAPLALTVDVPPPVVVPWYQTPGGIAGIVLAALVVLGGAGAIVARRRAQQRAQERAAAERAAYLDRETGVGIALAGGPLQYGHKREVVYRLAITNQSRRPRVALVDVAEVTNGWRAATQVAKLPLSVGETQHTTLVVTPDAVIQPGDVAKVVVRVKPEEAREKDERLALEVHAPKHGSPVDPHYKIVSVHREGA